MSEDIDFSISKPEEKEKRFIEKKFNLIDEKWIPAKITNEGNQILSIREVFHKSSKITGFNFESMAQSPGLNRVLISILYRSYQCEDNDEWIEFWNKKELPVQKIDKYLDKVYDRFWLFHPEHPFFQVNGLRKTKEFVDGEKPYDPIAKIITDETTNPNKIDLGIRTKTESLSYGDAALWLITEHSFGICGARAEIVGATRNHPTQRKNYTKNPTLADRGAYFQVCGLNLTENLLLNWFPESFIEIEEDDKPAWEKDYTVASLRLTTPKDSSPDDEYVTKFLEGLTYQSRRILLFENEKKDRVVGILNANGDARIVKDAYDSEIGYAWRLNKENEYVPIRITESMIAWDSIKCILPAESKINPIPLRFIADLVDDGLMPYTYSPKLEVFRIEYGTQNAIVKEFSYFVMSSSMSIIMNKNPQIQLQIEKVLENSNKIVKDYEKYHHEINNSISSKIGDTQKSTAKNKAFAESTLENIFFEWFNNLTKLQKGENPYSLELTPLEEWKEEVAEVFKKIANRDLETASTASIVGRRDAKNRNKDISAITAYDNFIKALKNI